MKTLSRFLSAASLLFLLADAFQQQRYSLRSAGMRPAPLLVGNADADDGTIPGDVLSRRDLGVKTAQVAAASGILLGNQEAAFAEEEGGRLIEFQVENVGGEPGKTGKVVIRTRPSWSPNGVARFEKLTEIGFWDDCRIFRVLPGFVVRSVNSRLARIA